MLNVFIIFSFFTTLILIGILFGSLLSILAIILSFFALVPFVVFIYSYLINRPIISYQIACKEVQTDSGDYIYRCLIGFDTKKGTFVAKDIFLSPELGIIPENAPNSTAIEHLYMLEETGLGWATVRIVCGYPSYPRTAHGYVVQFRVKEKKNTFKLRMVFDTEMDPMKQGILSVFHGLFNYRLFADVVMDFDNLDRQEGSFKSYY